MLVVVFLVAVMITIQTVVQRPADVSFTTVETIGPIGGVIVLGAIGGRLLVRLLGDIGHVEGRPS